MLTGDKRADVGMTTERTYRALLIGVATYEAESGLACLNGPANDVAAMVDALTHPDWGLHLPGNVQTLVDASKRDIEEALETFFSDAASEDQLFCYFSGHGIHEVHDRLFLGARDTHSDRPLSSAVALSLVDDLAKTTRAAATAMVLDCCFSGIMKGPGLADALDSRGRWTLVSSAYNQVSADATDVHGLSPFTGFVAEALVGASAVDSDDDGYVTMSDVNRYVAPRLREATNQTATFTFQGSGDLAVALAPGYDVAFDQAKEMSVTASGQQVMVPPVPVAVTAPPDVLPEPTEIQITEESDAQGEIGEGSADDTAERVLDAVETGREITVRRILQGTVRDCISLIEAGHDSWDELRSELDRLVCISAGFVNHRMDSWLSEAVGALVKVYEGGFDRDGATRRTPVAGAASSAQLWLAVYERVLALGALAVRTEQWGAVREIAMQRPNGLDFRHYTNWMRHALTMASRAELFEYEEGGRVLSRSVLVSATEHSLAHECLRPDLPIDDREALLDSTCQFDAAACVVAVAAAGSLDGASYYPNFSRFYSQRSMPVFRRLVSDDAVRKVLAPVPDAQLADLLSGLDEAATTEGFRYNGWHGFSDGDLVAWLDANRKP